MRTFAEIKEEVAQLPPDEQSRLLAFLLGRLNLLAKIPPPRHFTLEQMKAWIAEDEEDMRRFREETSS
jgi:hypothetical protein